MQQSNRGRVVAAFGLFIGLAIVYNDWAATGIEPTGVVEQTATTDPRPTADQTSSSTSGANPSTGEATDLDLDLSTEGIDGSGGIEGVEPILVENFDDDLSDAWIRSYPWNPDGPTTNDSNGNFNWYLPSQSTVDDGVLRLSAERRSFDGKEWVSGLVTTCSKLSFDEGHIEARINVPEGVALWPAFWLAGADSWPPEIDIFEFTQPDGELGRFGTNLWSGAAEDATDAWQIHEIDDAAGWHVWGLTWERDLLTWWLDGTVIRTERERLPDTPQCIVLNLAVGSASSSASFGIPDERTPDQAVMLVDWLRVEPITT